MKPRRARRRGNLLVLAGLPLVALHIAMLIERALHQNTVDALVIGRWVLAIGLLLVLRSAKAQARSQNAGGLALAAILIFALIHAPVAAPDPALPLAATGVGLALSAALVCPGRSGVPVPSRAADTAHVDVPVVFLGIRLERLKDRAPPALA